MSELLNKAQEIFKVSQYFKYGVRECEKSAQWFFDMASSEDFKHRMMELWRAEIVNEGGVLRITSPVGTMQAEFVTSMAGSYLCKAVVFHDIDAEGKKRDLYAVRLGIDPERWVGVDGDVMKNDIQTGSPTSEAMMVLLQKVLAIKLAADERRLENIAI